MKGIAALQLQRHAAIDNMLNVAAYEFSGVDQAMLIYHGFQVAMLGIGAKDLLLQLPRAVVGSVQYGARAFSKFAKQAGGRRKFLDILEGGEEGIRKFFGFGRRGADDAAGFLVSPRGTVVERAIVDRWAKGTFGNVVDSIEYHFSKHGGGRSLQEYTDDAVRFFEQNKGQAQWGRWNPNWEPSFRLKIGDRGGYFTGDGRVLTYWD